MSKQTGPILPGAAATLSLLFMASLTFTSCTGRTSIGAGENSAGDVPASTASPSTGATTNSQAPSETSQPVTASSASTEPRRQPTLAEAQAAVARIYKKSVTVDAEGHANPFLVGDFNGDSVEDIAVVVRPARGALAELNGELANWILEDAAKVQMPVVQNGRQVLPPKPEPVRVAENDRLLAIIHGYKQEAWRNEQAQQSYLLRNAVGEKMHAQPIRQALAGASTSNPHVSVSGDVIKVTRDGQAGYIYWTGAKYAWRQ